MDLIDSKSIVNNVIAAVLVAVATLMLAQTVKQWRRFRRYLADENEFNKQRAQLMQSLIKGSYSSVAAAHAVSFAEHQINHMRDWVMECRFNMHQAVLWMAFGFLGKGIMSTVVMAIFGMGFIVFYTIGHLAKRRLDALDAGISEAFTSLLLVRRDELPPTNDSAKSGEILKS